MTARPLDMPLEDLDAWLAAREAAYPDVRPDADARIHWASDERRRTPLSIIYLHGYSASRMETAPLSDLLAERLGANLFYARLAGHGRSDAAMGEPDAATWLRDAEEAFEVGQCLGERVIVIGCSTGGTLATLLAAREGLAELAAVVLIAPNFGPRDPRSRVLTWPGARTWVPWVVGAQREVEPENEAHARYWTLRYPSTSLIPMMELVQQALRAPLHRVQAPVLAFWCEADQVVDARRIAPTLARMVSADVESERVPAAADSSNHVIAGDAFGAAYTAPMLERILAFLSARGLA